MREASQPKAIYPMQVKVTRNPEKPSLHRGQRHPYPSILNNMHEENHRNPERRVEIVEDEPKRSEERLHRQEGQVNDEVIGPETSSRPVQVRHEVDDDIVEKYASCRERNVCKHVGDWVGCSSVHAIARL